MGGFRPGNGWEAGPRRKSRVSFWFLEILFQGRAPLQACARPFFSHSFHLVENLLHVGLELVLQLLDDWPVLAWDRARDIRGGLSVGESLSRNVTNSMFDISIRLLYPKLKRKILKVRIPMHTCQACGCW